MKIDVSARLRKQKSQAALTFVELLCGTSIIIMLYISVFAVMTIGISITQLSRENLRATEIMLDKMEGVRLYSWTQLNDPTFLKSAFTNWFFETNNVGQVTASGNGVMYTGTVVVASAPFTNSYSPTVKQVTVTVNWTSGNITRTRSMSTLSSEAGMQNYVFGN